MLPFGRSIETAIISGLVCCFGTVAILMGAGLYWHGNTDYYASAPSRYLVPLVVGLVLPAVLARLLWDGEPDPPEAKDAAVKRSKWWWRLLLYPAFFVAAFNTLLTTSPIPLWYFATLDDPVKVMTMTEDHLVLADGRNITLPFIKKLPYDNKLFQAAIANGVEIMSDGEVVGLMRLDKWCGHDPIQWKRIHVNLSNLAGALRPEGIDESVMSGEHLAFVAEHKRIDLSTWDSSHQRGHLTTWDCTKMRQIRNEFDWWTERQKRKAAEEE